MSKIELVEIYDLPGEVQTAHRVYALQIDGRCNVNEFLKGLKTNQEEYRTLRVTIQLVASRARVDYNEDRIRKDEKPGSGILEMRPPRNSGRHARLLFYYSDDAARDVICVYTYWKTKPSKQEQNRAFERARILREIVRQALGK